MKKARGDDATEKPWMRFVGTVKGSPAELAALNAAIEAEFETIDEEEWEPYSDHRESLAPPADDERDL